jgi:hypothetical protein
LPTLQALTDTATPPTHQKWHGGMLAMRIAILYCQHCGTTSQVL